MDHSKRPAFASQRYDDFAHNTSDWNSNNSFYYQHDFIHQMIPRYQYYNTPRFHRPTYHFNKRSNNLSYKNRFTKTIHQSKPNNVSNTNHSISDKASEIFDKVLGKQISETQNNLNTRSYKKNFLSNRKRKRKNFIENILKSSITKKKTNKNEKNSTEIIPCTSKEPIFGSNTATISKTCTNNKRLLNNNNKKSLKTKNNKCKNPKLHTTSNDIGHLSVSSSSVSSSSENELFHQPIHPTNKPLSSSIPVQLMIKSPPRSTKPTDGLLNYDIRGMSLAELKKLVTEPCSKLTQAKMNLMMKDMLKKKKVPIVTPGVDEPTDVFASLDFSNIELKPIEVATPEVKEAINLAIDSSNMPTSKTLTNTSKDSENINQNETKKKKSNKNLDAKTSKKVCSKEAECLPNINKTAENDCQQIDVVEMNVDNYVENSPNSNNNNNTAVKHNHNNTADHNNTTDNNNYNTTNTTTTTNNNKDNNNNNNNTNNNYYIDDCNNDQYSNVLHAQQNNVNNIKSTLARFSGHKDSTIGLILEMTIREEEISQQIHRITYEENQLQKAINDFSNKLNAHSFYKNMLLSESERLKSYRLQLLKDSVETCEEGPANVPASSEDTPHTSLQYPEKILVIQPTNLPNLSSDSDSDESYENCSNSKKKKDLSPRNKKSNCYNSRDTSAQNNELTTPGSDKNNNEASVSSSSVTYIGSVNKTNISQSFKTNRRKKN